MRRHALTEGVRDAVLAAAPTLRRHQEDVPPDWRGLALHAAAEAERLSDGWLGNVYGLLHASHRDACSGAIPSTVRSALHAVAEAVHRLETGR
jgi:hypothetical protein